MRLTRITSILGAVALGGVLVASTYGAQAARAPAAPGHSGHGQHSRVAEQTGHFQAPVPHKYGKNGMRMGLHCETTDMS
jgi:Spy/CpxP family protein refolding chaperone